MAEVYGALKQEDMVELRKIIQALSRAVAFAAQECSKNRKMGLVALLRELGAPI